MFLHVSGHQCVVPGQSPLPLSHPRLDYRLQIRPEHLPRPPHPLCPGVRSDRSQDHQQAGGGSHVQGGDHSQGLLIPRTPRSLPQPVLQLLHPRGLAPLCGHCKWKINKMILLVTIPFQVWVTLDLLWYSSKVCIEICSYLEVELFRIPYNSHSSSGSSNNSQNGNSAQSGNTSFF